MAASRGVDIELQLAVGGDGGVSSKCAAAAESCSAGNRDVTCCGAAIDEKFSLIDGGRTRVSIGAGQSDGAGAGFC